MEYLIEKIDKIEYKSELDSKLFVGGRDERVVLWYDVEDNIPLSMSEMMEKQESFKNLLFDLYAEAKEEDNLLNGLVYGD